MHSMKPGTKESELEHSLYWLSHDKIPLRKFQVNRHTDIPVTAQRGHILTQRIPGDSLYITFMFIKNWDLLSYKKSTRQHYQNLLKHKWCTQLKHHRLYTVPLFSRRSLRLYQTLCQALGTQRWLHTAPTPRHSEPDGRDRPIDRQAHCALIRLCLWHTAAGDKLHPVLRVRQGKGVTEGGDEVFYANPQGENQLRSSDSNWELLEGTAKGRNGKTEAEGVRDKNPVCKDKALCGRDMAKRNTKRKRSDYKDGTGALKRAQRVTS